MKQKSVRKKKGIRLRWQRHDFDGTWKYVSETYLPKLVKLVSPKLAAAIDWSVLPVFLDSELKKILGKADAVKYRVDRLIEFQLLDGSQQKVFLHFEFQNQWEEEFTLRIYRINRRIQENYGENIVSLVILTDENPEWRPTIYEHEVFETQYIFKFPICKLQDFVPQLEAFEQSSNPIELFIAAHLRTQQTKKNPQSRWDYKRKLHYWIYKLKLPAEDFHSLYLLIDDLMILPDHLQKKHREEIIAFEQEESMPYVSQLEQKARKEGRHEGRKEGLKKGLHRGRHEALYQAVLEVLEEHFGFIEKDMSDQLEEIKDEKKLRELLRIAFRADSLEEFQQAIGSR